MSKLVRIFSGRFKNLPRFFGRRKTEKQLEQNQVTQQRVKLFSQRKFPFSRFIVKEESMVPAFKPGDHVLTFNWGKYRKNDLIVFKLEGRSYLKRIDRIDKNRFYISGDNKKASTKFTPIAKSQI